jgi:pre-mRNA-splicing factor 18
MRRGDIERLQQEEDDRERERKDAEARDAEAQRVAVVAQKAAAAAAKVSLCSVLHPASLFAIREQAPSREATNSPHPDRDVDSSKPETAQFNISNEETIRRLRSKGQPIRLFAESDKDRRLRLRALELIEEKDHDRQGGQNDFKKALEDVENVEREMKAKGTKGKKRDEAEQSTNSVLDLSLVKSDPDKLYPLIYYALKRTLREWGEAMEDRPGTPVLRLNNLYMLIRPQKALSAQRKGSSLQQPRCSRQNT